VIGEVGRIGRQPFRRWVARLAWLVVPLVLIGEAGHHLLEALGQTLAHHVFHIVFAGAAAVAFVVYVAVDVRRNGWPTFTWRGMAGKRDGSPGR
jgi:uncharacterized membrane protein YhaH (DUF805 family)